MTWNKQHALYPYQQEAVEVMTRSNVLLAYDMGVGKTPTTIAAIELLRDDGQVQQTGTVVVPSSLKYQWGREIARFSDQQAVVIDGTLKAREVQYNKARRHPPGYLVMSYDSFVRDHKLHQGMGEGFLVLDEATAIKAFDTKRTKYVKAMQRKYTIRYALTGTPIENGKAEELFSIMEFVEPSLLGRWWDFEAMYIRRNNLGWIEGYRNLDRLHRRLKRNVLRRSHKDPEVAKHLPAVIRPDPITVRLDKRTDHLVRWISDDILADLDGMSVEAQQRFRLDADPTGKDHPDGVLMSKIQVLRMLLDYPEAVLQSSGEYAQRNGKGSKFAHDLVTRGMMSGIKATPKADALEQYLNEFFDASPYNKAVVFVSFVAAAHEIRSRWHGSAVLFTGAMSAKQRDEAKNKFATKDHCRLFVSTDAGGYGLDLPQANLLVNYDLPWQAGLLAQRSARIRRASSKWKHVVVQDFLVEGTIEERMLGMLQHKIALADAIIDGEGITEKGGLGSDLESLREFLTYQSGNRMAFA